MSLILAVKCGYPLSSLDDVIGSVSGYSDPALVGSNATVWCPLTGSSPTVIRCMSNGKWNPEPGMTIQACSGTDIIIQILYINNIIIMILLFG